MTRKKLILICLAVLGSVALLASYSPFYTYIDNLVFGTINGIPGSVPDEIRRFDGAMPSLVASGVSTAPATPAYTTNVNGDLVFAIFTSPPSSTFTNPSGLTNTVAVSPASTEFGVYAGYQTKATAGSVAAVTATFSSSQTWAAATLPLAPSGSTTVRTAQTVQQASGATATVTKPTGLTAGDFMLGCDVTTGIKNNITPPSGFQAILVKNDTGNDYLRCYAKLATSADVAGSNFVFTEVTTANPQTAFIIAIAGILEPDEILTSASASFTSADVTKDICVSGGLNGAFSATNPTPQSCGTIASAISGTTLSGWGIWNTASNSSALEYRYGTDNGTALQNAVTALTQGGTIYLPSGGMMILGYNRTTQQIVFPTAVPVNIIGQGSGVANWVNGQLPATAQSINNALSMGSEVDIANTALTGAAWAIVPATGGANGPSAMTVSYDFENFTLWGGAGTNGDGGGKSGITADSADRVYIKNVVLANFTGSGWNGTSANSYAIMFTAVNSWFTMNGTSGLYLSSSNGTQNVSLINDEFDANVNCGVELGAGVQSFTMAGTQVTRNNQAASASGGQLCVDSSHSYPGWSIGSGNYWEIDGTTNQPLITGIANVPATTNWGTQTAIYGSTGIFTGFGPTFTGTGACATSSTVAPALSNTGSTGNSWVGPNYGSVECTGTAGASTLVITPPLAAAPNYWECIGSDTGDSIIAAQSGTSTTTCTLKFTTTASNPVIAFQLHAF